MSHACEARAIPDYPVELIAERTAAGETVDRLTAVGVTQNNSVTFVMVRSERRSSADADSARVRPVLTPCERRRPPVEDICSAATYRSRISQIKYIRENRTLLKVFLSSSQAPSVPISRAETRVRNRISTRVLGSRVHIWIQIRLACRAIEIHTGGPSSETWTGTRSNGRWRTPT